MTIRNYLFGIAAGVAALAGVIFLVALLTDQQPNMEAWLIALLGTVIGMSLLYWLRNVSKPQRKDIR